MAYRFVTPKEANREIQCEMWKDAVVPTVMVGRLFNLTHVVRKSRRTGVKLHALMMYCVGMAVRNIPQFYYLYDQGNFRLYDSLNVQTVVLNKNNTLNFCDVPFSENFDEFYENYKRNMAIVYNTCENLFNESSMSVATSAVVQTELDSLSNQYTGWHNPFVAWGRYRRNFWGRCRAQIFLQFDHRQMDGLHVAAFYNNLQRILDKV